MCARAKDPHLDQPELAYPITLEQLETPRSPGPCLIPKLCQALKIFCLEALLCFSGLQELVARPGVRGVSILETGVLHGGPMPGPYPETPNLIFT